MGNYQNQPIFLFKLFMATCFLVSFTVFRVQWIQGSTTMGRYQASSLSRPMGQDGNDTATTIHLQPVSELRLTSVPPEIEDDEWISMLESLGMDPSGPMPNGPHYPDLKPCTHTVCPRVVLTVFLRWGDLHAALLSLRTYSKVSVVIMDKSNVPNKLIQDFPSVEWMRAPIAYHLASGWNLAFEMYSASETHILLCNEDIFMPVDWLDRLDSALERHSGATWIGMTQSIQFSGFLLPVSTWKAVGAFDDNFSTYYEDDDYWLRIEECFGRSPDLRPLLIPDMKPVVIHRRTGWHFSTEQSKQMAANRIASEQYLYSKWQGVLKKEQCNPPACCVRGRNNKVVVRKAELRQNSACRLAGNTVPGQCRDGPAGHIGRLIDAFLINNELNVLEARLNAMGPMIDAFLLVESNYTLTGKPSPMYFDQNRDKFQPWAHKIKQFPFMKKTNGTAWDQEKNQRNHIFKGLKTLDLHPKDLVFITDVDEIIDLASESLITFLQRWDGKGYVCLGMDMYYFNSRCKRGVWTLGKMATYETLMVEKDIDEVRRQKCTATVYPSGWHLSYFGGADSIREKLRSFAHTEKAYLADSPDLQAWMDNCTDFIHTPIKQLEIMQHADNPYPPPEVKQ